MIGETIGALEYHDFFVKIGKLMVPYCYEFEKDSNETSHT